MSLSLSFPLVGHGLVDFLRQPNSSPLRRQAKELDERMKQGWVWSQRRKADGGRYHKQKLQTVATAATGDKKVFASLAQEVPTAVEVPETHAYQWTKQWYATAVVDDLDASKPHAITVLGENLVLWRDGSSTWRCFEDRCPHRCTALSEGRIEPRDGTLQCSYHGWRFEGSGRPKVIPQMETSEASEREKLRALEQPQCAAKAFPTQVLNGLLWVWPDDSPSADTESTAVPPYISSQDELMKSDGSRTPLKLLHVRDLPVSYEALVENLSDQSHVAFTHHKVASKGRDAPYAAYFKLWDINVDVEKEKGFSYKLEWSPNAVQEPGKYICKGTAPSTVEFHTCDEFSPILLQFLLTPIDKYHVRLFSLSQGRISPGLRSKVLTSLPKWFRTLNYHRRLNNIFDGDLPHLTYQDYMAANLGTTYEKWAQNYALPADADRGVKAFRRWLHEVGGGGPFANKEQNAELPYKTMSREQLLDRYTQHTSICPTCKKFVLQVESLQLLCQLAAAAFGPLSLLCVIAQVEPRWVLLSGSLAVVMLLSIHILDKVRSEFYYQGYDHSKQD